jgi:hypothetical protein
MDRLILSGTSVCHCEQAHELGKRSLGKKITVLDPKPGVAIVGAHEGAFRLLFCAMDPKQGDDTRHIVPRLESRNCPMMVNILGGTSTSAARFKSSSSIERVCTASSVSFEGREPRRVSVQ